MFATYLPCDAILAGVFLRPEMATNVVPYHIDIELGGNRTRGQVVIDHLMSNKPNAFIIQDFDSEIFKDLLLFAGDPFKYKNKLTIGLIKQEKTEETLDLPVNCIKTELVAL